MHSNFLHFKRIISCSARGVSAQKKTPQKAAKKNKEGTAKTKKHVEIPSFFGQKNEFFAKKSRGNIRKKMKNQKTR